MAPGVIGMTVLFSSIFNGVGLLWDRQFGFLIETLVAPVPRVQIMTGRILGGATVSVVQGTLVMLVCLIAGFRPGSFKALPTTFFFMLGALIAVSHFGAGLDTFVLCLAASVFLTLSTSLFSRIQI